MCSVRVRRAITLAIDPADPRPRIGLGFRWCRHSVILGMSPVRCSESMAALAGVIQLVECQLPKLDVAGSSPVARS